MDYYKLMNNMKRIREDQKLSLPVIARATGIPQARLREAEEGGERLTIGELDKLLAFYQMSANDVMRYRKPKRSLWIGMAAGCLIIVLAFGLGLGDWLEKQLFGEPQQAASENLASGEDTADEELALPDPETVQESGEAAIEPGTDAGGASGSDTEGTSSNGVEESEAADGNGDLAAAEPQGDGTSQEQDTGVAEVEEQQDGVILRFWGNIPYHADRLPFLADNDDDRVIHVIPIEMLSAKRPDWLAETERERYILNVGTADIWTDQAIEEWERLRSEGYAVIGLGRLANVYDPYIMEVAGYKIGFLSLAGLIHEKGQIAYGSQVGLPRAYDKKEVQEAVSNAKRQVDYLFVLPHVGNKRGEEVPVDRQQKLARYIVEAGGDFVIGNRSIRSQQADVINGVPILYSLGRSVSADAQDGLLNYVVDIHVSDSVEKVVVHVGETDGGKLRFDRDLSQHQATIEQMLGVLHDAIGHLEFEL